ncbi:type I pullulanase [Bacteroides sp. 214]|uniref:type I pullulanase n=1 Tax=Bacteroides sp. 214 TaxID=2302935 RepID=UPI0013D0FBD6|nr:type I pullulanase [Bacteroides sp. 214]NDW11289.1 type I pullulanase [Bacteroides sp. 214]
MKTIVTLFIVALTLAGCTYEKKEYATFDDYPVRTDNLQEVIFTPAGTRFVLWAPTADFVRLNIYKTADSEEIYKPVTMNPGKDGVWTVLISENLEGKFYTFNVKIGEEWLGETPGIGARAVSINGKRGAIINPFATDPIGWERDVRPPFTSPVDMIIYETHYRDFTIHNSSGLEHKGKYLGLSEKYSVIPNTFHSTGLDHLKFLGVTHVHFLPSFDFAAINENTLHENNYSWGYSPLHYNVPEGSYATNPADPITRIREFKQMIMALHSAGIRVVLDVSYTRTCDVVKSPFELTVPGYFYRHGTDSIVPKGDVSLVATNRAMVRKFIVESVRYWVEEFHVDGFCFNEIEEYDTETLTEIRKVVDKIDSTILMYGKDSELTIPGVMSLTKKVAVASSNVKGLNSPQQINYASIHDELCLMDYHREVIPNLTTEQQINLNKLAQTAVLTSQGVPFILSGEEMMRTKKGILDTSESSDLVNAIDWNNKIVFSELCDYYKALIALRKNHPAFRMTDTKQIHRHLEYLPVEQKNVIAFRLRDHANGDVWRDILVVLNADSYLAELNIPKGEYTVVCSEGVINEYGLGTIKGPKVIVPGYSTLIAYRSF